MQYKISPSFSVPVIDVEATSKNLKRLREERNLKTSEIQSLFNMTYPQAIYNWENPDKKDLPNIDHLVALAKFYKVSLDELIVIKKENTETLQIKRPTPPYAISHETLVFIILNTTSDKTKSALEHYYNFSLNR